MTLRTTDRNLADRGGRILAGALAFVAVAALGCDDTEWSYRGTLESEWRRLADADEAGVTEASRILLLMDERDCRVAFDAVIEDLDSADPSRRVAALESIADEDAYRRWFPDELGRLLERRATEWQAPVADPRREHWTRWVEALPRARTAEGRALMRAFAADPNTALGMAGPLRTDRVIAMPTAAPRGGLRALR